MAVALNVEFVTSSRMRERFRALGRVPGLWPAVSCLTVVAMWEVASLFVSSVILPSPGQTISGLVQLANLGILGRSLGVSLREMYVGLVIGGGVGALVGIFLGMFKLANQVLQPYVNIFNAVPGLILIPWFVIIFGLGSSARTAFIIFVTFFPMVINARAGILDAGNRYMDLGKVFGLSRLQTIRTLILPAGVPYLFTGLKISMGTALVGMIVSEIEISFSGIGYLLVNLSSSFETAKVIGVVLLCASIGVVQVGIVRLVETRWLSWMRWA